MTPDEFSLVLGAMAAKMISVTVSIPEGVEDGTENTIRLLGISGEDPAVCGWDEVVVRVMKGERGDVNADGSVNILDVVRAVNIILGIGEPASEFENWAADCNADETVNILDVVGIVNAIVGTGECEP